MKTIHNKKRNSLFLYEVLVRQLTKTIINKQEEQKQKILAILKEHFKKNTLIAREIDCYKNVLKEFNSINSQDIANKFLQEIKKDYDSINKEQLFLEQSKLIKKINFNVDSSVYLNYVPNYKNLATIYQLFNSKKLPAKSRIILEENLVQELIKKDKNTINESLEPINKLALKRFVENFNTHYSNNLLLEQQKLLERYILSSFDNIELKLYLNEEIGRLKNVLTNSFSLEEIKNDKEMEDKTKQVLNLLEEMNKREIDLEMIGKVLEIQQLSKEIESND
jgi:hypothetical protein